MMKKAQVLEALENGCRILVDSIYRTATVFDAAGDRLDSCRYDTADRIKQTDGYKSTFSRGWSMAWIIEKEQPAQEAAPAQEEAAQEEAATADRPGLVTEEEAPAPDYLRENWPTSNENPNIYYSIENTTHGSAGVWFTPARTVDDLQSKLAQLQAQGCHIRAAWRHDRATGERRQFIPETRREQADRENREHCQRIAERLEMYNSGDAYKCPHCGEVHTLEEYEETEHETGDGWAAYNCPWCGEEIEENDLEAVSLYDYFEDCLDIEYRCCSDREYRSVRIMVTCGGPNIYIDTAARAVQLYWWTDYAEYPLLSDAVEAVDAWAEEYWSCL